MQNLVRIAVLVGALLVVALGLFIGVLGMAVSLAAPGTDRLVGTTVSFSVLALAAGLGLAMAWQAWQAVQERPASLFRPRRVWLGLIFFVMALAAGQVILTLDLIPALIFPPFHVAAAVLPPLIILGLAGRVLSGLCRRRDLVLQVGSGAFLSTFVGFFLEMVALLGLLIAALVAVAVRPGGQELLQAFADRLNDPTWLQDPAALSSVAWSPIVVIAVLAIFALIVPLIEETVKTAGVGLMAYRRPTMAEAYLWGMAGGAGFAVAEGLLNSASGLEAWVPAMLARVGAALLHCFTGGLMGLAWYRVLVQRRWGQGLGLYAASIGVHGAWNALAAVLALMSLNMSDAAMTDPDQVLSNLGLTVLVALFVSLAIAVTLGLAAVTRYVRNHT
jgi:hypothetical protein